MAVRPEVMVMFLYPVFFVSSAVRVMPSKVYPEIISGKITVAPSVDTPVGKSLPGASVTVSCAIRCLKLRERLLAILPVAEGCSDAGPVARRSFSPVRPSFRSSAGV